jgi:hypothetical protein
MLEQFDLFAGPVSAPPPPPPAPGEVVYSIVPKGDRFGVNWRCNEHSGVLGGLYDSVAEAERGIEFRRELRDAGIRDPRPWMRIPPEGIAA